VGACAPPRAEKFFSGPNLQGRSCKCTPDRECTPEAEQESNVLRKLGMYTVGEVISVVLACVLKATT